MSRKRTDEEIKSIVENKRRGYKVLNVYRKIVKERNRIYLDVLCCENHEYTVLFDNIIKEYGGECPECRKHKISEKIAKYDYATLKEKLFNSNLILLTKEDDGWREQILCKCAICETEKKMTITAFEDGRVCGCVAKNKKRTQEEFEELFYKSHVKEEYKVVGIYKNDRTNIEILHLKCNNIFKNVPRNLIKRGDGCPCCGISSGEEYITNFLNKHKIAYIRQVKFDDLVGVNGGKLSYDFFIPKYNLLIEFQGVQHEKPVDVFGGVEALAKQKEHDKRKREYSNKNGYRLLEIWHYEFESIEDILMCEIMRKGA